MPGGCLSSVHPPLPSLTSGLLLFHVVEVTSNDDMVCCEVGLPDFFPQSGSVSGCPRCIGVDDGQLSAVGEVEGQVLRPSLCYDSFLLDEWCRHPIHQDGSPGTDSLGIPHWDSGVPECSPLPELHSLC